ncbi:MAG TPA: DNA-binding protein [Syntrophaceae bacterium]|jgi:excisionase family DNA binding protein|nr:DNA-binding protein [Syntrophaceae bacterium]
MNTAEKIYNEIVAMPVSEREKLFAIIARKGFEKDYYKYEEVFEDIPQTFTIKEAAEYLEVAEITVRRWTKEGKLPFSVVGKNYVYSVENLRRRKQLSKPRKEQTLSQER